jgi:hypothetical protein
MHNVPANNLISVIYHVLVVQKRSSFDARRRYPSVGHEHLTETFTRIWCKFTDSSRRMAILGQVVGIEICD